MSSFISLGFVVDTASVLAACPSPSQDASVPTPVAKDHCFLIAPPTQVRAGLATDSLNLAAKPRPILRWQGVSLSGNTGQSVIAYDLEAVPGAAKKHRAQLGPTVARVIVRSGAQPCLVDGTNTDPPTFSAAAANTYFLETPVRRSGEVPISIRFYLTTTDTDDGQPALLGYFQWNATLTVL